ncbi:hypothetical protein vseg_018986 [Gypsophila vaccaria]
MGEVKLFRTSRSPFSWRVEIALKLKGIEYEIVEEELSNKSEELVKYNPIHKKIPVLVHNGKSISESLVILEYIDEVWKDNALLPIDPYDRAQARFWAKLIDDKIFPLLRSAISGPQESKEKAQLEVSELLKALEAQIKAQKLIGSNKVGYLDIVGLVVGYWAPLVQDARGDGGVLSRPNYPWIFSWVDGLVGLPQMKDMLPDREDLLAYFRDRFANSK